MKLRRLRLKYTDFVNLRHKPKETDIICTFYVEPEDIIVLIVNEVNQACKKKALKMLDLA